MNSTPPHSNRQYPPQVSVGHLIDGLCQVYKDLLNDDARFAWFKQFYGLRDFIHALKLLRRLSRDTAVSLEITVHALERNFNGTTNSDEDPRYRLVLERFLGGIFGRDVAERVVAQDYLRQTVDVLRSALGDTSTGDDSSMDQNAPRYKLIIDESDDDSMLRLLQQHGFVDFERRGAEVSFSANGVLFRRRMRVERDHIERRAVRFRYSS